MQMTRLAGQGRISEFFGPKALNLDKFMLSMDFYERSKEAAENLDEPEEAMIDAYLNGVNDFINSVKFFGDKRRTSANLLPPEFYIFKMTGDNLAPFNRADILNQGRLVSFHLSWNWNMDIAREAVRESHPELADLVEELLPFTTEFLADLVTTVDDEDLKIWGQFSDTTLQERYNAARSEVSKAHPPLDNDILMAH